MHPTVWKESKRKDLGASHELNGGANVQQDFKEGLEKSLHAPFVLLSG